MKILHTSDWHIGKRLGRHDRMGEFAEVLAEVEAIADERAVDLVLVSGDIWDRPMPPTDALHLGLQTLLRLEQQPQPTPRRQASTSGATGRFAIEPGPRVRAHRDHETLRVSWPRDTAALVLAVIGNRLASLSVVDALDAAAQLLAVVHTSYREDDLAHDVAARHLDEAIAVSLSGNNW